MVTKLCSPAHRPPQEVPFVEIDTAGPPTPYIEFNGSFKLLTKPVHNSGPRLNPTEGTESKQNGNPGPVSSLIKQLSRSFVVFSYTVLGSSWGDVFVRSSL